MLIATAHGAALHAMLSCDVPALYPRQIPIVVVLRKHLTGTTTWGEDLELDAWPPPSSPSMPADQPAGTSRSRLEPGRQTRRAAKVGRVHPNHPAALRQGMP